MIEILCAKKSMKIFKKSCALVHNHLQFIVNGKGNENRNSSFEIVSAIKEFCRNQDLNSINFFVWSRLSLDTKNTNILAIECEKLLIHWILYYLRLLPNSRITC